MTILAPTPAARIDAREITPHARHGRVFERLAGLPSGDALELISDHGPSPLRARIERQHPGRFDFAAFEAGPALWRLEIRKVAAPAKPASGSCCSGGACCG